MDLTRYFDNAASTPCDPRVIEEMLPFLHLNPGNPHSIHAFGRFAESAVEQARQRIAELIGAEDPSQIIFASGATEANHLVLHSFGERVVTSLVEHSSVREMAQRSHLKSFGQDGSKTLLASIGSDQVASLIAVSNEVGTMLPPEAYHQLLPGRLHLDATQLVGKLPLQGFAFDFLSGSGHKFYGPKGIGFLFAQDPTELTPLSVGGGQENGLRSGTLNVPGIVGMGMAASIAADQLAQDLEHAQHLRSIVWHELGKKKKRI